MQKQQQTWKWLKLDGRKVWSLLTGINREVLPKQILKLATSIDRKCITRPVIVCTISFITGKSTTYIIDGQHLYHACLQLRLDIPYIEIEIKDMRDLVETIAFFNSSSKSWTSNDYILSWSAVHVDYKKLMHYLNTYQLESRIITGVLSGSGINNHTNLVRRGDFRIKNEKYAANYLSLFSDIVRVLTPKDKYGLRNFAKEFYIYYSKINTSYNHNKFMQFCKENKAQLNRAMMFSDDLKKIFYSFQRI